MFKTFVGEDVTYSIGELQTPSEQSQSTPGAPKISSAPTTTTSNQRVSTNKASSSAKTTKQDSMDAALDGFVPELSKMPTLDENYEDDTDTEVLDIPWLFYVALTSIATFIATYTDMSPLLFFIIVAGISLISFRFLIKVEKGSKS